MLQSLFVLLENLILFLKFLKLVARKVSRVSRIMILFHNCPKFRGKDNIKQQVDTMISVNSVNCEFGLK